MRSPFAFYAECYAGVIFDTERARFASERAPLHQSGAFSVVNDGQINLTPDETAIKAARDAMNGYDPTNGCLYYYNPAKTTNQWMLSKPVLLVIGNHSFFK